MKDERDLAIKEMSKWAFKYGKLEAKLAELREAAAWYIKAKDNLEIHKNLRIWESITQDKLRLVEQDYEVANRTLRSLLAEED